MQMLVGIGGLGLTSSPRDPRFAASILTEVYGYFSGRKNPEHNSSGREISGSLNRPMSKMYSAYSRPSNTLVPIQLTHEAMDLTPITLLQQKISVTKIALDKEILIRERSKLFKGCCALGNHTSTEYTSNILRTCTYCTNNVLYKDFSGSIVSINSHLLSPY